MKRIMHALAALAMTAIASMVWVSPAHAAPSGPCSIEELRNPANFVSCAQRARAALTDATSCISAPRPGSPTSGLAGMFASEPDSAKRDGVQGQYSLYGVGGYGLDTYNIGCLGNLKNPDLVGWNTMASGEFTFAAAIMGASNGLRENAYDPGSMWDWADTYVAAVTMIAYNDVFSVFGAVTIAAIGLFLLWTAKQGHMSHTFRVVAWAIFMMIVTTGLARWPTQSVHAADASVSSVLRTVQGVLGPGPRDIPADECVLGGDACTDHRSVATRASDAATEAILYRSWVRAVLGTADSETAKKYGPVLYNATTMNWSEAALVDQDPSQLDDVIKQKADTFNTFAAQIQHDDPLAYEHLQGVHGSDRFGAGAVAVMSAASFSAFDMTASAVIIFGYGLFRLVVAFFPLLATLGLFLHTAGPVRRAFNMTAAAAFNIVVFGSVSGVYLTFVCLVFRSPLPGAAQMVIVGFLAFISFLTTRPLGNLVSTATGRPRKKEGFVSRAFRGTKQVIAAQSAADPAPAAGPAGPGGAPVTRPETLAQPDRRAATRTAVVDALAPSVGEVTGHPMFTAAVTAAQRPENDGFLAKAKAAATAAATVAATAAGGPAAGAAANATANAASSKARARRDDQNARS